MVKFEKKVTSLRKAFTAMRVDGANLRFCVDKIAAFSVTISLGVRSSLANVFYGDAKDFRGHDDCNEVKH